MMRRLLPIALFVLCYMTPGSAVAGNGHGRIKKSAPLEGGDFPIENLDPSLKLLLNDADGVLEFKCSKEHKGKVVYIKLVPPFELRNRKGETLAILERVTSEEEKGLIVLKGKDVDDKDTRHKVLIFHLRG